MGTLAHLSILKISQINRFSLEHSCCNRMPTNVSSPHTQRDIYKTKTKRWVEPYHKGPAPMSSHVDINPVLSSASLNNLFKPCLTEASAVTSEG